MNINDRFQQVIKTRGTRPRSLVRVLDEWTEWVDDVIEGYTFSIYEYESELMVRDLLAEAESQLGDDPSWEHFGQQLSDADTKLKDFLAQGPRVKDTGSWWERRMPPIGGRDFAEDIYDNYGTRIETID